LKIKKKSVLVMVAEVRKALTDKYDIESVLLMVAEVREALTDKYDIEYNRSKSFSGHAVA
jgi:hypothetical protein